MQNKLQEEGEKNKEMISNAPLPLVEHFDLVFKRKSSYARGLGVTGITSKTQENLRIQAELDASKIREMSLEEEIAKCKEALDKQDAKIKRILAHLESNEEDPNMPSSSFPSSASHEE